MQANNLKILFKTKGGHKEGMGDVTSSLALAEELGVCGYDISFIINNNKNVVDLARQSKFKASTADSDDEIANCLNGETFDIAILNQLNTPESEALLIKKHSTMLVTIEDTGNSSKIADLRFNVLYPITDSITDFKFIPLSSIYQQKHGIPKEIKGDVSDILVTQGGSDTYGFIPKIVKALANIEPQININIVIGPNFAHEIELKQVLSKNQRNFNIIRGYNDLSDSIMSADLAISAGGNTLFEMACLGVPTLVVCAEPFEVETVNRLQSEGFGINLGFGDAVNEIDIFEAIRNLIGNINLRKEMSAKGKELIDGRGIKRMVEIIKNGFYTKKAKFMLKNKY